jgi:hypothetical protein
MAGETAFKKWRNSHQPFHWFVYGILNGGGFDVSIGNPSYIEYRNLTDYRLYSGLYQSETCGNLLAFTTERSLKLIAESGRVGLILLVSTFTTDRMSPLQDCIVRSCASSWISNFAWRPSKLFDGCNTIKPYLSRKRNNNSDSVLDRLPVHTEDGQPVMSSQCKHVNVDQRLPAHALLAILSSSLFFWYYQSFSDCQQSNTREFSGFRFGRDDKSVSSLKKLGAKLAQDYWANSRIIERRIMARRALVKKQYLTINLSKPIIDEIDTVLAHHYGFTEEELDFIINYDITYRMGLGGGTGADDEE